MQQHKNEHVLVQFVHLQWLSVIPFRGQVAYYWIWDKKRVLEIFQNPPPLPILT